MKKEDEMKFRSMAEKRRYDYFMEERSKVVPVLGLDDRFVYPHYSDMRFASGEHLIFGTKQKVSHVNYSDRLWQWDYDKASNANKVAEASGYGSTTARYHQVWLSAYEGKEVDLKYIYGCVHRANGQTIYAYGYNLVDEVSNE